MNVSLKLYLPLVGFLSLAHAQAVYAGAGHKAHVHGTAELDLVVEGQEITILFESPADSIYGFEHEAKTEKDIKARDTAVETFKTNVSSLFSLPESLGCVHSIAKLEAFKSEELDHDDKSHEKAHEKADTKSKKGHARKGTHGEFEAEVKISCKSTVKGQTMDIGLFGKFSGISKIKTQILGEKPASLNLTKKSSKINL